MNIIRENLLSGMNARFLNIALIALSLGFLAWTVSIWMGSAVVTHNSPRPAKAASARVTKKLGARSSYNMVVNNDIFRASRRKYVAAVKPVSVNKVAPRVATRQQLPNLTLLGTVILDDGVSAIIALPGNENDAKFYKVGERIGGFTVSKISNDSVILKSGRRELTVHLSQTGDSKIPARGSGYRRYGK